MGRRGEIFIENREENKRAIRISLSYNFHWWKSLLFYTHL